MVAETSGALVSQFLRKDSPAFNERELAFPIIFFNDPSTFVRSAIDELMFRIAVQSAFDNTFGVPFRLKRMSTYEKESKTITEGPSAGNSSSEILDENYFNGTRFPSWRMVNMDVVQSVQVYKAAYPFLGGAIAIIFLAVTLVIPLFHGFWHLGRRTSLSPLETATALGAPLLATTVSSSNGTASEIMKTAGKQRVQYGELDASPLSDTLQGAEDDSAIVQRRLQIGRVEEVEKPVSGSIYH